MIVAGYEMADWVWVIWRIDGVVFVSFERCSDHNFGQVTKYARNHSSLAKLLECDRRTEEKRAEANNICKKWLAVSVSEIVSMVFCSCLPAYLAAEARSWDQVCSRDPG